MEEQLEETPFVYLSHYSTTYEDPDDPETTLIDLIKTLTKNINDYPHQSLTNNLSKFYKQIFEQKTSTKILTNIMSICMLLWKPSMIYT